MGSEGAAVGSPRRGNEVSLEGEMSDGNSRMTTFCGDLTGG
jgi:hypothetical protein